MKKVALLIGTLMIPMLAVGVSVISSDGVFALSLSDGLGAAEGAQGLARDTDGNSIVTTIINILLWLVVILSVIMLIFGGIKYATSAGSSEKITSAKNTITYAIIGLIIAVFSWALISWITTTLEVS